MLYKGIVGSCSHGIEIPKSDTDICFVDTSFSSRRSTFENGENVFEWPASGLIQVMLMNEPPWFLYQILFPEKFLEETALSKYIEQSRDQIIKARLPVVYSTLLERAEGLKYFSDILYERFPKRMTYSTLCYSILANYAEGMPFAQAHRPEGELHDFLVGTRIGQVPLEDAVARNELERLRAEKAAGFYKEAVRPEILREFEHVILEEITNEKENDIKRARN